MGSELRVCSTKDVPTPSSRRFDVEGHRLCVVHLDDDWYAIGDRCSHANESLAEGDIWVEEREIECPKHGSTFDLCTGEPQALPATKPVPVYEVRVDGDDVLVTLP
jgi:3-phenylpropionate/trans-cinnamate dioxygenase ferredoxin component